MSQGDDHLIVWLKVSAGGSPNSHVVKPVAFAADASPDATDVSGLGLAPEAVAQTEAQRRIAAPERERLGIVAEAAGGQT